MEKVWKLFPSDPQAEKELSISLGCSPFLSRLLIRRGLTKVSLARNFLYGSLSDLHSPSLLPDIDLAVSRLKRAITKGEKILIYGDYDVDGQTSIAVLREAIKSLGGDVSYYIPHRLEEGYGLNEEAITEAREKGFSLILTVDCGSTALKEAKLAKELGLDLIVTDHHEFPGQGPESLAFINPHRPDSGYPDKDLAGVGLAFKLSQALLGLSLEDERLYSYLDLVALGTIADIVPLRGENRIFAREGLKVLSETERLGIKALKEVSGLKGKVKEGHVGFILGPRLNAAGRISEANLGVELLLTPEKGKAETIARLLDSYNRERQEIERGILAHCLSKIDKEIDLSRERIIVLSDRDWHAGVIGIVASRILDKFSRPVILISLKGEVGKGSGRSLAGFNLFQNLEKLKAKLISFGGHKYAAGLNILLEQIPSFKEEINRLAKVSLGEKEARPSLDIDAEISFKDIGPSLMAELRLLPPYGAYNPAPLFISRDIELMEKPRLVGNNRHLKFFLRGDGRFISAIGFGLGGREDLRDLPRTGIKINLAYVPEESEYLGVKSVELKLKDVKPSSQAF